MASLSEISSIDQRPLHSPLDTDSYPIAPPELSLEQVHVYVRHGERTPVRVRMADPPASIPAHWNLCRTARQFRATVATFGDAVQDSLRSSDGIEFLPVKRVVERADGRAVEGECLLGELTDIGRQSTYSFGRYLRKIYIDKLGFLPDTLTSNNEGYFRSTNMPRTIESLQQVMHGLYPRSKIAHGVIPQLRVRNGLDENLVPNAYACKRLEFLLLGFAQAAAAAYNHTLEPLDEKLSKYIGGKPIRIDGQPRASGILDTIRASTANGIRVPPEFMEKPVMDLIEKAVVTEWFADKTEEVRRLGMGRLLDDLLSKMNVKVDAGSPSSSSSSSLFSKKTKSKPKGKDNSGNGDLITSADDDAADAMPPPKILVHGTHDTALAALLATLDVFDEKWPQFTASVTFELFKKNEQLKASGTANRNTDGGIRAEGQSSFSYLNSIISALPSSPFSRGKKSNVEDYYIRVRYQNQTLPLPFCAGEGQHLEGHPELCTFEAFRRRVSELVLNDRDNKEWEKACSQRGGTATTSGGNDHATSTGTSTAAGAAGITGSSPNAVVYTTGSSLPIPVQVQK